MERKGSGTLRERSQSARTALANYINSNEIFSDQIVLEVYTVVMRR